MIVKEIRLVYQEWYETEYSKTGWDTNTGWYFKEGDLYNFSWEIVKVIEENKHGLPTIGIAEKLTTVEL